MAVTEAQNPLLVENTCGSLLKKLQDIAYAKLANLDPQYALYTSFVCPLVYAIMGSSRDISIVPVVVVSLLLGTLLTDEISDFKSHEYLRLAGATQMALDVLRLGFLIDFLSHASIVGFMDRAAITIALQQLKGFLGIKTFTKKTDIVSVMRSVFNAAHHGWNCKTIVIAVAFLAFLLITKYIAKKNKKLFGWLQFLL
ncbi:High affinity sulfate transporter 2 [Glycine max]|uniref:high affinity sulfate transporter 2 isoform X3 n=1 Tax=Glycine max TaxID=3847 RepID=UPI0003DEB55B|nr:high affinity sulfate transporter 2 isoform X3 [Glycine max]KAH1237479.1 High affinity sulfate transporter 2 [Glycine max]|eukprot:XP_006585420.1 high affinity sulfate transporter 2 isoform X3 [Glycine max]